MASDQGLTRFRTSVKERGGQPIPVTMDHGVDSDVEKLFEKIKIEQNGKLMLRESFVMNIFKPLYKILPELEDYLQFLNLDYIFVDYIS